MYLAASDISKKGKGKGTGGKFQPLVAGEEDDSDNDNLVVDENPKRTETSTGTFISINIKTRIIKTKIILRSPSPSMRDAIQGMLSMSQMGPGELFTTRGGRRVRLGKSHLAMEDEEKMETCYKDDEFARVQITIPMGERPHREGVKKEAIEQGLAAAAAKAALPAQHSVQI
ncbi:hypothetical protein KUTeg_021285 [Tegillarca granosa]|uniref:Uncharacterized protein n=1 Tax=Tegillarca granosa TaxID=220873 RepID=A0ABQ9EAB3_TEGGR|nr:hypothetical protein KUTeg_021285 [Tegillarca granosa]